jgi:subtilisin family serine protease
VRRVILGAAVLLGLTTIPATATADPLVMPHVVVAHNTGWAALTVHRAGGTVVATYPQIGVVVAYTAKDDFAAKVRRTPGIDAVGATRTAKIPKEFFAPRKDVRYTGPNSPNSGQVPPEGTAWDVPALHLPEAHQVTDGSRRTVVGVLDVGVDDTHPDLKPAFDAKNSVSCLSGWADRSPGAWRPTLDGHGTHVAGTIAAAHNGSGVLGVAPGTRIAAVKLAELYDT